MSTEKIISETLDTIDGTLEILEGLETIEVVRNDPKMLALAGIAGIVAGGVGGYFIAKKILSDKYEERIEEEMSAAKQFYAGLYKTDADGAVLSPQDVMAERHGVEAVEALRAYQGVDDEPEMVGEPHDEVVDEEIITRLEGEAKKNKNVFDDTFDLEVEKEFRTPDAPYIITHDEYFAAEREYETVRLTYFEADDTLINEEDKIVDDVDGLIGEPHLVRFGSGSRDRKIVYIRNEKLETDFEVVKDKGSYLESLGLGPEPATELRHSDQRDRRRAFRHGDG
jgi:hypothetical protein